MFKISIITSDNFAVLGMNGVSSFFDSLKPILGDAENYDSVQFLDEKLMDGFRKMETFPYGFTEEYKTKFIKLLEGHQNEKILITDDWLIDYEGKKEQSLMKFVGFLNQGLSFDEAKLKVNQEMKEVELG